MSQDIVCSNLCQQLCQHSCKLCMVELLEKDFAALRKMLKHLSVNLADCSYHPASLNFCQALKPEYFSTFPRCEKCQFRLVLLEIAKYEQPGKKV